MCATGDDHDDTKRKALHVVICQAAGLSLDEFCLRHGVSRTAFIDAVGHLAGPTGEEHPEVLEQVLALARRIDGLRRAR